jgi:hypothetical protein
VSIGLGQRDALSAHVRLQLAGPVRPAPAEPPVHTDLSAQPAVADPQTAGHAGGLGGLRLGQQPQRQRPLRANGGGQLTRLALQAALGADGLAAELRRDARHGHPRWRPGRREAQRSQGAQPQRRGQLERGHQRGEVASRRAWLHAFARGEERDAQHRGRGVGSDQVPQVERRQVQRQRPRRHRPAGGVDLAAHGERGLARVEAGVEVQRVLGTLQRRREGDGPSPERPPEEAPERGSVDDDARQAQADHRRARAAPPRGRRVPRHQRADMRRRELRAGALRVHRDVQRAQRERDPGGLGLWPHGARRLAAHAPAQLVELPPPPLVAAEQVQAGPQAQVAHLEPGRALPLDAHDEPGDIDRLDGQPARGQLDGLSRQVGQVELPGVVDVHRQRAAAQPEPGDAELAGQEAHPHRADLDAVEHHGGTTRGVGDAQARQGHAVGEAPVEALERHLTAHALAELLDQRVAQPAVRRGRLGDEQRDDDEDHEAREGDGGAARDSAPESGRRSHQKDSPVRTKNWKWGDGSKASRSRTR